jgi:hypothetical protein
MNKEEEFRSQVASIAAKIAIKEAQIMANPLKYLESMNKRCNEVLKVLQDVEYALSPDLVFDIWSEGAFDNQIKPIDIQGEAYLRCNAAKEVLRKYRAGE